MKKQFTIATRQSPLALWQANHVKQVLVNRYPELIIELLPIVTKGDKLLDTPLAKIGGKGLFLKELETALLDGRADIAVHSMKDVPMNLPHGLVIAAVLPRGSAHDVYVSKANNPVPLDRLPAGSIIGTSSARRKAILHYYYPALTIKDIRGNLQTRLDKLEREDYAGIILAAAGVERLGLEHAITENLALDPWLPAPGQGAIGIECVGDRTELLAMLNAINHVETHYCVTAERAVSRTLNGSCAVPLAAHALLKQGIINLNAWVASPDKAHFLQASGEAPCEQAASLGIQLAQNLLAQGFQAWQSQY